MRETIVAIVFIALWSISKASLQSTQLTSSEMALRKTTDLMKEVTCLFDIENGAQICNCGFYGEGMYLPKMGGNTFQVSILNCKSIHVRKGTFADVSTISKVSFTNIENLILEPKSLEFPLRTPSNRVQLEFLNAIIEELPSHSISGNIDVINFEKCHIGIMRAFAITGLIEKAFRITFSNTIINRLEPQVLKKISVDQLLIQNCDFISFIPSRALYDLTINEIFSITSTNFTGIFSSAFMLKEVDKFVLKHNRFNVLDGSSFQMQIRKKINIEQNIFNALSSSAFESIVHSSDYFATHSEPLDLEFSSNAVDIIDRPISIKFTAPFHIKLSKLYFIHAIECLNMTDLKTNPFFKSNGENIFFKIIGGTGNESDMNGYHAFSYILNNTCVEQSYLMYIIIGVVILIVIIVLVLIILLLIYIRKRKASQMDIIHPEGKTYRETQIIMQIENAGLLKTDL